MREVEVLYHQEPEGFWAESPTVDGFVVAGDTLDEVRHLVKDGLPFYLEDEIDLYESFHSGAPPVVVNMTGAVTGLDAYRGGTSYGCVAVQRRSPAPVGVEVRPAS